MKNKIIISSILTIALCLSMIAGSTFALFTSNSEVNATISSAKVDIKVEASDLVYASTLSGNDTLGSAQLSNGNVITLEKLVPGDYVTFTLTVTNNSTVAVNYRALVKTVEDNDLLDGLVITYNNAFASHWDTLPAADENGTIVKTVTVRIELPETAGNEYQGKSCKLAYIVEAVQGNYVAYVESADDFKAALAKGIDELVLDNNVVLNELLTIEDDVNIYLNGHDLSVSALQVTGDAHITGGTITSASQNNMQPHVVVKEGATLTLEDVEVEIDDYMNYQAGGNKSYAEYVGVAVEGGTLVLDNAHIVVENDTIRTWNYCYGITVTDGTVIMNGGSITSKSVGGTISNYATAISSIGNSTVTLNNVEVDAPLLGILLGTSHLVVNSNNSTFTSTVFDTSMGSGTYEFNNSVND